MKNYFEIKSRICKSFTVCTDCPFSEGIRDIDKPPCSRVESSSFEKAISIVDKWDDENPTWKTRQEIYLEKLNISFDENGILNILPCHIDKNLLIQCNEKCNCETCRIKYWEEKIN